MRLYDYIKDSEKVVRSHSKTQKKVLIEPNFQKQTSQDTVSVSIDYNLYNKHDLVRILLSRGITHTTRMRKADLVRLLEQDDKNL